MTTVTTIMTVYNGEKYLREAIESVLKQSLSVDEFIVVDDGSTDSTLSILQNYPQIKIIQKPNSGMWDSLNIAINEAKSEYLAFCDADDLWHKDKLQMQMDYVNSNPRVDMVFGLCQQFKTDERTGNRIFQEPQRGLVQLCMIMRKSKFLEIGNFDISIKAAFIYWFQQTKLKNYTSYIIPQVVAFRRIHETNLTRSGDYKDNFTLLAKRLIEQRKARI